MAYRPQNCGGNDNDGLTDIEEAAYGTSPTNPDTDGDGFWDGQEVLWGSNATNALQHVLSHGLAGGLGHALVIKYGGTVWGWGWGDFAQTGRDMTVTDFSPARALNVTNSIAVAAGQYHALALTLDGHVLAWGANAEGGLGDGSTIDQWTAVPVASLTNAVAISAGALHSLALLADGTIKAWGSGNKGKLGNNQDGDSTTPVDVDNLSSISAIAGGGYHSLALRSDGTVWAWGNNEYGQLGDGTFTDRTSPVPVTGLTNISVIAAGGHHSLAQLESRAILKRTSTNSYERRFPDGSKETYGHVVGATPARKVFLNQVIDPASNVVALVYDGSDRLTSIIDALGQTNTLAYTHPSESLLISKVTDPFGRFAEFSYNSSNRLERITDVIDLESAFTYGSNDFINTLSTPSGTTSFAYGQQDEGTQNVVRWLEATDPLGAKERLEFRQSASGISTTETPPTGMTPNPPGDFMHGRNSFFWDKLAMSCYELNSGRIFG